MGEGVSERHMSPRACTLHTIHTLQQMSGDPGREIWN